MYEVRTQTKAAVRCQDSEGGNIKVVLRGRSSSGLLTTAHSSNTDIVEVDYSFIQEQHENKAK